ncbi:MAG: hypothetical protein HWN68_12540 [Desulfobacterales bacterium]|nr:hypothetical protein [Desulfobacterales bacterium]
MSEIRFKLKPVAKKSKRGFKRRSKYAPILDRFIEGEHDLVRVEVENRSGTSIRTQLIKLIEKRGLEDRVKASVADGALYLEKV